MSSRDDSNFAEGSVSSNILRQAIPLMVAQLVHLLYNIVDRIYIGHLPGASTLALTGIGLVFPFVSFVAAFTQLYGQGGVPLCSIERGRGDTAQAEKIEGNTLTALLVTSVVIMVLCYIFRRPVLYLFGASDDTYVYANAYLQIYLIGTVFSVVGTGMNGFINSQGFPRIGMLSIVIGAVINLVLDPIFIFAFGMGVAGAAIATVIAQGVSCLWVMSFLLGKKPVLHLRKECLIPDFGLLWKIVSLGFSGFIMQGTNCAVQVVCNVCLKMWGGDLYVGIMTVLNSVREIVALPITGLTNGAQPVLGYNYGAKQYQRVWDSLWYTFRLGMIYSAVICLVILLFPGIFIHIFNSDADMLKEGIPAMRIYFGAFLFQTFQFCGQTVFVGLGRAKSAVFFSLLRKAIIVIPLTILLPYLWDLGVNGVYLAEPISNIVGGLACYGTMLLTVGRELKRKAAEQRAGGSN